MAHEDGEDAQSGEGAGAPAPSEAARILKIELDPDSLAAATADAEHERRVAIFDLLEANVFALHEGPAGPYHYDAIRSATPDRIEAIDMGRRGLHNEGSELLMERLKGKADMDFDTARRLFTLICALHRPR